MSLAEADPRFSRPAATPPRVQVWNDPAYRAVFYQIALLAFLGYGAYVIVTNTAVNLAKQNQTLDLGFLNTTAPFDISISFIDFNATSSYGRAALVGIINTLVVSVIGIVLTTILGFLIGIARLSSNWLMRNLALAYVEIVRNVPILLVLMILYFSVLATLPGARQALAIPGGGFLSVRGLYSPRPIPEPGFGWVMLALLASLIGTYIYSVVARRRQVATGQQLPVFWPSLAAIVGLPMLVMAALGFPLSFQYPKLEGFNYEGGMVILPEALALTLGLVVYTASYISEIVRSGILAVAKGQKEAARALGLTNSQMLRLVVIPQAMRVVIPPMTNQYLNLTKNSSLAIAIGFPDVVGIVAGTTLNQTGQAIVCILLTMAVYLTFSLLTSLGMNWFNARVKLIER